MQSGLALGEFMSCMLALFGVAALSHGRRWGWLAASAGSLGYTLWNWAIGLPGQAVLNALYLASQLWGWKRWGSQPHFRDDPGALRALPAIIPLGAALSQIWSPADAWLTAAAAVTQVLTSLGVRQVWRCWLLIDLASAAFYASLRAWPTCLLYLVFGALAESAHRHWSRSG